MAGKTMYTLWSSIRHTSPSRTWSTLSRASPPGFYGRSSQILQSATIGEFSGVQVTSRPHAEAHHFPSSNVTSSNSALRWWSGAPGAPPSLRGCALYPRPEGRGFTARGGNGTTDAAGDLDRERCAGHIDRHAGLTQAELRAPERPVRELPGQEQEHGVVSKGWIDWRCRAVERSISKLRARQGTVAHAAPWKRTTSSDRPDLRDRGRSCGRCRPVAAGPVNALSTQSIDWPREAVGSARSARRVAVERVQQRVR